MSLPTVLEHNNNKGSERMVKEKKFAEELEETFTLLQTKEDDANNHISIEGIAGSKPLNLLAVDPEELNKKMLSGKIHPIPNEIPEKIKRNNV